MGRGDISGCGWAAGKAGLFPCRRLELIRVAEETRHARVCGRRTRGLADRVRVRVRGGKEVRVQRRSWAAWTRIADRVAGSGS